MHYSSSYSYGGSSYTTIVRNNIISNVHAYNGVGYGVNNVLDTTHTFILENNCVYNSAVSAYNGNAITQTGDIFLDPNFADRVNHDYHLKSTAGRYTESGWIIGGSDSPCIDAGNPSSDYSLELSPNGNRINIGRYGNTAEASMSVSD